MLSLADITELLIRMRRFVGWIDSSELSANVWHEVLGPEIPSMEIALAALAELVKHETDPRRFTAAALLDLVAEEVRNRNYKTEENHREEVRQQQIRAALKRLGRTAAEYEAEETVRIQISQLLYHRAAELAVDVAPPTLLPVPPSRRMRWDAEDWMK